MKILLPKICRYVFASIAATALSTGSLIAEENGASPGFKTAPQSTSSGVRRLPPDKQHEGLRDTVPTQTDLAKPLSNADRNFILTAGLDGAKEVYMGQIGQKSGKSDAIKTLGKMIELGYTRTNQDLMALAKKKGVRLDPHFRMPKIWPSNFDQVWLDKMISDHQVEIAYFKNAAQTTNDVDVKLFATKTLPILQRQLNAGQKAQPKKGLE